MQEQLRPSLPSDVIKYIVDFIPSALLHAVLLTSRALQEATEPRLYCYVNLSNCRKRSVCFLRTIAAHPELARHVITFAPAISYHPPQTRLAEIGRWLVGRSYGTPHQSRNREIAYFHLAESATRSLTNVKSFTLLTDTPHFVGGLTDLHSIERFRICCNFTTGSPNYGQLFDHLPLATHLELPPVLSFNLDGIRPEQVPRLEELVCGAHLAMRVVPNKPVRKLVVMFPYEWQTSVTPHAFFSAVTESTVKITVLGITVRWTWRGGMIQLVHAIGIFLPDVEELYLAFLFSRDQLDDLRELLAALPRDLESFKSLRVLDFSGSESYDESFFDHRRIRLSKMYLPTLYTWGEHCPTLCKVVFPNGTIWVLRDGEWRCNNATSRAKSLGSLESYHPIEGFRSAHPWTGEHTFKRDLAKDWEWPDSLELDPYSE